MLDFDFQCKTELIVGKNSEERVGSEVAKYSRNILLVYGGGSIKKSGLYGTVVQSLEKENIFITELSGIKSNPELGLVRKGVEICREKGIDFILAVGGGSVIDTAKVIAMAFYHNGDAWDIHSGKFSPQRALPVGTVLTIAAAGSEASQSSVVTNENGLIKKGFNCELSRPVFSILNPEITYTLPDDLTFSGVADMMSHVHERYFTDEQNNDLTDALAEAVLSTIIKNAKKLKVEPEDYNARAQIMLCGTFAHNDLVGMGRIGDYATHKIEHELSALYGINHGKGIAVITIAWMLYVYQRRVNIFVRYATRVWNVPSDFGTPEEIALEGIRRLKSFFQEVGLPVSLDDLDLPDGYTKDFDLLAEKCSGKIPVGNMIKIEKQDVINILKLAKAG